MSEKLCNNCNKERISKGKHCEKCKSVLRAQWYKSANQKVEGRVWKKVSKLEYIRIRSLPSYFQHNRQIYVDTDKRYYLDSRHFTVSELKSNETSF